jgi:hypothetical protein
MCNCVTKQSPADSEQIGSTTLCQFGNRWRPGCALMRSPTGRHMRLAWFMINWLINHELKQSTAFYDMPTGSVEEWAEVRRGTLVKQFSFGSNSVRVRSRQRRMKGRSELDRTWDFDSVAALLESEIQENGRVP